ncbi:MAG: sulfatase [Myxococcales bacterium]|nr:sulfatase [Myxococcales bacterium]
MQRFAISSRRRARRRGLATAALALAATSLACERATSSAPIASRLAALGRPHLVLIVVDTLRPDWTTPYGQRPDTSPELARWAARGVVFEQARAQSSWTKTSMASLFTSLWPHTHGVVAPDDGLAAGARTVAELLAEAGYATCAVQTNGWLHPSFGFHQGFERYVFPTSGAAARLPKPMIWPHADRVVEEAARLIRGRDRARPLFLYLHFMDVHEYAAPREFKRFGSGARGDYLAAIRWVDDALERVRIELDRAGLLDQTIVILASDHGEAFGENGRQGHARNVLTAAVWVPLVIRFPFASDPIRIRAQVRNVDIAPTLLALAGAPQPPDLEGRSLLPLLAGANAQPPAATDRPSFASLETRLYADASIQRSVSDGSWLYARNAGADASPAELLFDRGVDPGENVNLIDLEPRAARRLRALLEAEITRTPRDGVRAAGVSIDPSIAERLRALGYLPQAPTPARAQRSEAVLEAHPAGDVGER